MLIMSHDQMRSSDSSMGLNDVLSNVNNSITCVKDVLHHDFAAVIHFFFATFLQSVDVPLRLLNETGCLDVQRNRRALDLDERAGQLVQETTPPNEDWRSTKNLVD